MANNDRAANRHGLNIEIYDPSDLQTPLLSIPYANVSEIDLTRETVWATEGAKHGRSIGFHDSYNGTFKISTQIMTLDLLALLMDKTITNEDNGIIVFGTLPYRAPKYYSIKADTVWKNVDGTVMNDEIFIYRACPKRALNLTYNGEGDPMSVDVEFEIISDNQGYVMDKGIFPPPLNDRGWEEISAISEAGTGANYFDVGDCKEVILNGTVGTLSLSNVTFYVYILGFDHNSEIEGEGISFGCFKTAIEDGVSVALCDSHYDSGSTDGSKWFNMNHSLNTNSGGWKGCDMRYDILGSVEVKDQQDATSAATSSPVENTLMAALPSALRAVMKPITKYTDNVGDGTDTAANVTTTVDYLPLLAEKEIFGSRTYANSTEQSHQAQYAFYANGNSKIKYNHSSTSSAVFWWERSASATYSSLFCRVSDYGTANNRNGQYSYGVAPAFLV